MKHLFLSILIITLLMFSLLIKAENKNGLILRKLKSEESRCLNLLVYMGRIKESDKMISLQAKKCNLIKIQITLSRKN